MLKPIDIWELPVGLVLGLAAISLCCVVWPLFHGRAVKDIPVPKLSPWAKLLVPLAGVAGLILVAGLYAPFIQRCTMSPKEVGFNRPYPNFGYVLNGKHGTKLDTAEQCLQLCRSNAECLSWTWVDAQKVAENYNYPNSCWIKSATLDEQKISQAHTVSGKKVCVLDTE